MERPLRVLSTEPPHTSLLKISEGCDHACAFCAIPSFRGLHRSAPLDELVAEAQALSRQGVKELNIISQDTTWYGRDLWRKDRSSPLLPGLLRALVNDTDVPWYRLFYMYPSGITTELVELMTSEKAILPYLDMPLQHGSDRMLEAMRRPERQSVIRERVAWLRDAVPDLTLRTTVIVGFPGETDEDFGEMLDLLEEVRFDRVGAFTYSVEDGTHAAEMPDQVPESLMRERLEQVMDLQRMISAERNAELVGHRIQALIDDVVGDPGPLGEAAEDRPVGVARTVGQAVDVDGVTHLYPDSRLTPGDFVTVEIVDAMEYDLIGRVVAS
jgi:ribosomal protein S12 methylthiotransferase